MPDKKASLFSDVPVSKAVLTLAVPTVISQLITVVYNMADTFFIGQLNDPLQVAAATLAMPCFMFLTAFANLFGLGGSSLISRCLGSGDRAKARHTAALCITTGIAAAFLYGISILLLEPVLFPLLGAKEETWDYLRQYVFWTIGVGAVPTVMNAAFAHLIRSEGYSKTAGFGVALGGILNIVLDPVFIFVFRLDIAGAAMATMLSNLAAYPKQHGYYAEPEGVFPGTENTLGGCNRWPAWICNDDDIHDFQYSPQSYDCRLFQHGGCRYGDCKKNRPVGLCHLTGDDAGNAPVNRIQFQLRQ